MSLIHAAVLCLFYCDVFSEMLCTHLARLHCVTAYRPIRAERRIVSAPLVSGQGTARSCEPSLPCQRNVLNSNDAALTSACDSVQELRLVRAGEAKADRMKSESR